MAKRYVVTGHMAAFDTGTNDGLRRITFYRGQPVPADATPEAVAHNLSVNLIAEVPGGESAGVDAAGAVVVGDERLNGSDAKPGEPFGAANALSDEQAAQTGSFTSEVDTKRAAARAKLPADGAAPHANAGQAVWVEYLVSRGSRYEDVSTADKDDLVRLAKQQS